MSLRGHKRGRGNEREGHRSETNRKKEQFGRVVAHNDTKYTETSMSEVRIELI